MEQFQEEFNNEAINKLIEFTNLLENMILLTI